MIKSLRLTTRLLTLNFFSRHSFSEGGRNLSSNLQPATCNLQPGTRLWSLDLSTALALFVFSTLTVSAKDTNSNLALAQQLNLAFVEVAEKVTPSVVVVTVTQKPSATPSSYEEDETSGDFIPREFRRYFRRQNDEALQGQGSGIILREDGYILTNGHVIEDAAKIEVRLYDGRVFKAKLRGLDVQSDLAVIKIDAKGLPVARLADSNQTRVGEFAIAIGAPWNLDYSVTYGHVSAKGRSNVLFGEEAAGMDQDFIQTDANINPGNSGGPLVNINGEVIGINTLIRGLRTGIGFAIPSTLAKEICDQLIAQGKFTRAWLGVEIRALRDDPDLRDLVKGVNDGVEIRRIRPDGPAAKSDLQPADIITAVDGKPVATPQQLRGEIRGKKIGEPISLDVFRQGKSLQVKVKPAEWVEPANTFADAKPAPAKNTSTNLLGLTVHALTHELATHFGVEMTPGVIVVGVEKNSTAARQGLAPGDIITSVNQQPVVSPNQFRDAIRQADLSKGVILNLVNATSTRFEILKDGTD